MKRRTQIFLVIVAVTSSTLCACYTAYNEANYYALTKDDAQVLAADASTPSAAPAAFQLRIDCRSPKEDGERDDPICEEVDIHRGMPLTIWRPHRSSMEFSVFEYHFDGQVLRDLDGEVLTEVTEVDVFAVKTSTHIVEKERRSMRWRAFIAGAGITSIPGFLLVEYLVGRLL